MKRVKNLMTEDGNLKLWENISCEFHLQLLQFMNWFGLLQTIPNNWKSPVKSVHYLGMLEYSRVFLNGISYGLKPVSMKKSYTML